MTPDKKQKNILSMSPDDIVTPADLAEVTEMLVDVIKAEKETTNQNTIRAIEALNQKVEELHSKHQNLIDSQGKMQSDMGVKIQQDSQKSLSELYNNIKKEIKAITKLKDGRDGINGKDAEITDDIKKEIVDMALKAGPFKDIIDVRDTLESLPEDQQLDISKVRGSKKLVRQEGLDRAVSILDSRTGFLIAKVNNLQSSVTTTTSSAKYGGSDIVVDAAGNGDYLTIQEALDAVPNAGATVFVVSGTYTVTTGLTIKKSNTRLILGGGVTVQCNGGVVTTLITATSGLSRIEVRGGKWLQTTATAQGTGFDFSNISDSVFAPTRIEEFDIGIKMDDTTSVTFYNRYEFTQIFNCNTCIRIGVGGTSTQPNAHQFYGMRCRPKTGGAGYGVRIADSRGISFYGCDFEPGSGGSAGITGVSLEAGGASAGVAREISFFGCWIENNETGVNVAAGCTRNTFTACSLTSNTTVDYVDAGTNTVFINCNKTGTTLQKLDQYNAITSTTSINTTHSIIEATSGTFTATLPTSVGAGFKEYTIKNSGTGVVTLATTSSQTIDGQLTYTLNQYDSITVRSNDANWIITAKA